MLGDFAVSVTTLESAPPTPGLSLGGALSAGGVIG